MEVDKKKKVKRVSSKESNSSQQTKCIVPYSSITTSHTTLLEEIIKPVTCATIFPQQGRVTCASLPFAHRST